VPRRWINSDRVKQRLLVTWFAAAAGAALAACSGDDATGCDYVESMDTTNNTNVGGTLEATSLTLGASPVVVCGEGNSGHFDTEDLDWDAYTVGVGAAGMATLTLTATAPPSLSLFDVTILDSSSLAHGTATLSKPATVQLAAGSYHLEVRVQNPTPISASFAYRITLAPAK